MNNETILTLEYVIILTRDSSKKFTKVNIDEEINVTYNNWHNCIFF